MNGNIQALCGFLEESKTFYHANAAICRWLTEAGYSQLDEGEIWSLVPGGKYFVVRNGSSLVAFRLPKAAPVGYVMAAAHSDRPTFMVRENGEITGKYTRLSTEKYGGMIISTWLDRPLSIAGRVLVQTENGVQSKLVDIDRDLTMIPNLAIHMNRTVNESQNWNVAVDTLPLLGAAAAAGKLQAELEQAAGGKILGQDLYLYLRQKPTVWGVEGEYLSGPGLDDLDCVFGITQGFLGAGDSESIPVLCVFDSEEVGSNSAQGADGTLLSGILERISRTLGMDHDCMLSNSFMVSADNAHAIHPNHPELSDGAHPVELNGGVVIKFSASQSYTSDGLSAAVFRRICQKADVPTQTFYNRADLRGGATLGHFSLHQVSVPSVDIGLAQLAMHSCYETAGAHDPIHLINAMTAYYSATLRHTGEGYKID